VVRQFSQDDRLGTFHSPSGTKDLFLLRFNGRDQVNDLFDYYVEVLAEKDDIDFDSLLGHHGTVELYSGLMKKSAWFDGIITDVEWSGARDNGQHYSLRLQPWTKLMSLRKNQRIFHEKPVDEILKEVFQEYNSTGPDIFKMEIGKDYPILEYTVQFDETDLAFAQRMLERFGIASYFSHEKGKHTLHLVDSVDKCAELPGKTRKYLGTMGGRESNEEHFTVWTPSKRMTTGAIRLTDYHFKKPDSGLELDQAGNNQYKLGSLETYLFRGDMYPQNLQPGGSVPTDKGKQRAELRLQQAAAYGAFHFAEGDTILLRSGMRIVVEGENLPRVTGKEFVCMGANHIYTAPSFGSGGSSDENPYQGSYTFQETAEPFVPPEVTPAPSLGGPQTAKVVGEGEIDVDEYGRILVHFPWDLDSKYSMRCRVSQAWAGKGWGGMIIPRIGMEVIVEFISGNADMPIITGCVYNDTNMPHYKLPDEKTRTIMRTDTHEGEGYNEISFEDKSSSEEIYVRAMKDMNSLVGNNLTQAIDKNKVEVVGNSSISEISNSTKEVVGGDMTVHIGPRNRETFTKVKRIPYSDGGEGLGEIRPKDATELTTEHDGGDLTESAGSGNLTLTVEKDRDATIDVNDKLEIGNNRDSSVGVNETHSVGTNRQLSVGKNNTMDVGKTFHLNAGSKIILECGASKIEMDSSGNITLQGIKIVEKAAANIKMRAAKIDIN